MPVLWVAVLHIEVYLGDLKAISLGRIAESGSQGTELCF